MVLGGGQQRSPVPGGRDRGSTRKSHKVRPLPCLRAALGPNMSANGGCRGLASLALSRVPDFAETELGVG
eukprot:12406170-Alexandrium_andersonii.AAC.1